VALIESQDATLASLRDHPAFPGVLQRARDKRAEVDRAIG
jgi:hypothetical protein